jgi:hypothetical protein
MKRGGKNADHENFEQATGMVMKVVKETKIPQEVEELFKDPQCENLTEQVGSHPGTIGVVESKLMKSPSVDSPHPSGSCFEPSETL